MLPFCIRSCISWYCSWLGSRDDAVGGREKAIEDASAASGEPFELGAAWLSHVGTLIVDKF